MPRNKSGPCCNGYSFKRIADLASADGVEFTLGQCETCKTFIVDCYAPYGPDHSAYNNPVVITDADARTMLSCSDTRQLKIYMRNWFNDIT